MAGRPRSPLHARIGRRVRALRLARGLTQARLAEDVGCSSHFVSGIERGVDSPSLITLERLAGALDTSLVALLDEERQDTSPVVEALARKLQGPLDGAKLVTVLREAVAAYESAKRGKRG
jgi:transcriptional regulator with XRE-family HTH domain